MADPRGFLLNTDYPVDHIVCFFKGSITVPAHTGGNAGTFTSQTIAHSLGFAPLLDGYISTNSDFSGAVYGLGKTIPHITSGFWSPPGQDVMFPDGVSVGSNSSNLLVTATNATDNDITYYYELFGFMPSDVNVDVEPTATQGSSPFIFNSDYNYCKLLVENISSVASGASTTINHGLGFVPQVSVWVERPSVDPEQPNRVVKLNESVDTPIVSNSSKVVIDTSKIVISHNYSSTVNYHYRIYADESGA